MEINKQSIKMIEKSQINNRMNYWFLNTPEQLERMKKLRAETISLCKKVNKLKDRINGLIESKSLSVSEPFDSDLRAIVDVNDEAVSAMYPTNSFNHLFWKQQKEVWELCNVWY